MYHGPTVIEITPCFIEKNEFSSQGRNISFQRKISPQVQLIVKVVFEGSMPRFRRNDNRGTLMRRQIEKDHECLVQKGVLMSKTVACRHDLQSGMERHLRKLFIWVAPLHSIPGATIDVESISA